MGGRYINEDVKRRLYAESMGRCMNPDCKCHLFGQNGDIIEKAHIHPYCESADNTFENLVLLCPNCHTEFDKNHAFSSDEVLEWKKIRQEELEHFFGEKCKDFNAMKAVVVPLLLENKNIYEQYYLGDKKELWDRFEPIILANNRKLKCVLNANLNLFQRHIEEDYSNLYYVKLFIAHIDEFESTRSDENKIRAILFPKEIDSIFGIKSVEDYMLPSTETLEALIEELQNKGKFDLVVMGVERPYIQIKEECEFIKVYLDDTPQLRQIYHDHRCFRSTKVRLDSLNFALKYINSKHIEFTFLEDSNLREILVGDVKMTFIYEYCLSKSELIKRSPEEGSVVVNLHNWNGESCISDEAREQSKIMNVQLLTMNEFYDYIRKLKS